MPQPSKGERKQLLVRLPAELDRELREYAEREGCSVNDVAVRAITFALRPPVIVASPELVAAMSGNLRAIPGAVMASPPGAIFQPIDPITGQPIPARKPYQKGQKR